MSTLSTFGPRQQQLLTSLLHHRNGLTVDQLIRELEISRNAVHQHLASLESGGFVQKSSMNQTGGRPSRIYTLTEHGLELFPRHYSLFSSLLFRWIKEKLGEKDAERCMRELGKQVAEEFSARVAKAGTMEEKIKTVTEIMKELGYDTEMDTDTNSMPEITASNCIFHQLAAEHSEVCELDLSFLSSILKHPIDHKECMVRGGSCCRFALSKK